MDNTEVAFADTQGKAMASTQAVVKLTQGQRVWVASNNRNDLLYPYDSTFSGFLIKQDYNKF